MIAAASMVACGPSPIPSDSAAPFAPPSASASASALPDDAPSIDEAAYLTGDVFELPIGEAGMDWLAPSAVPVMPDGQRAARVAFLPASCTDTDFNIMADPAPHDGWETALDDDGSKQQYEFGWWPAAQESSCGNGRASTYLDVAYRPIAPLASIHLVASLIRVDDPSTAVDVVPVFTTADASQPSITSDGFVALGPIAGPERPRKAKPEELYSTDFVRVTLPDGTMPSHWGLMVTGCGSIGPKPLVVSVRVDGTAPITVGRCAEGSFSVKWSSLPLPADGTPFAVLTKGGTTKSRVRISEFQWRGDRQ